MPIAENVSICVLCFLLTALPCGAAERTTYEISHLFSNVGFSIQKFFFNEEGGFRDYTGEIICDRDHPELSRVRMVVRAASIDTRINGRDEVLRSDDFFDVERYPTLEFKSTHVTPRQGNVFDVAGDLTIHGVTKHITVPVRFVGMKQQKGWGELIGFETTFTIDRTDFGVNGARWSAGQLVLSREVKIHLVIGGVRRGSH